ncbi:MAG: DUF3800 domain-containing protein [Candidatus Pedobacter colombiensis]|uniref:DUF3800 domain-containing protein n=1 Tax=Candidatus Pedobacter colombiensis TaxID=3121371 RepID=A0AAJ5WC60_9SPHI|nr:DUF3800 domain-containing protein [Pedobacter sp.]WEK21328.1 MAG: DUF3800 domain-containing protein [Pedobacter sp.]
MRTGIFIDDTGNAGNETESIYDGTDRKSWLALILTPEQRIEAADQMGYLLNELKTNLGADEFHFKDIYNGQGQFKGVDIELRKQIFRSFANIFYDMNYPMLIQTMTAADMARNKLISNNPKIKADNFKLTDTSDFALFILFFRIKHFLTSKNRIPSPVDIIIDEGRQKPNTTQRVELLGGLLHNSEAHYKSSHQEPLIQLVDYAAFCLNRGRWILTHAVKKPLDREMLEIFSSANFNVLNMKKQLVKVDGDTTAMYDKILADTYAQHSHLGELDLEDMIRHFYR